MEYRVQFSTSAERWLRVRSGTAIDEALFTLDEDGFLEEPSNAADESPSALIRPRMAAERGALVLLGEPGIGKSTTFSQLSAGLIFDGDAKNSLWINGPDIAERGDFDELIGEFVDELPTWTESVKAHPPIFTLIIDQFDECPYLKRFTSHLKRRLKNKDLRSLRVLIACRTADFPDLLADVLRRFLGSCIMAELAPLTRQDVATLITSAGIDADAFLSQVVEKRVGPLATIPLTLQLLAALYRDDSNALQGTPYHLFQRSIIRLADEHDRTRADLLRTSTAAQRVAVAGRIAARMILSGQRSIWAGESALIDPTDVTEESLSGGTEKIDGSSFAVTPAIVAETLKSALFIAPRPERRAFIHSTVAAFLGARYLAQRLSGSVSSRRQLASLFLVAAADEDSASIPTHLRETAAWLLEAAGERAHWLAIADPDGLMAHSSYISSDASRAIIVQTLLDRAEEIQLSARGWKPSPWQIAHSGLAAQLHDVLSTMTQANVGGWGELARIRLAVELARDCRTQEVVPDLVSIAGESKWPGELRRLAVRASMDTDPAMAAPHLRQALANLADSTDIEEEEDRTELVGTLLDALWPLHIELAELLVHVHPIRDEFSTGMYWWTMTKFPHLASEDDLQTLVEFAEQHLETSEVSASGEEIDRPESFYDVEVDTSSTSTMRMPIDTVDSVVDRLLMSPDWSQYLPAVSQIIARRLLSGREAVMPMAATFADAQGNELASTARLRRILIEKLIESIRAKVPQFGPYEAYSIAGRWRKSRIPSARQLYGSISIERERGSIVDQTDLEWIFDRIRDHTREGSSGVAEAFGFLAAQVADLTDPHTFELVYSQRETVAWTRFAWFYGGIDVDGTLAKSMKMNHRPKQPWAAAAKFAQHQRENLGKASSGDPQAFWVLVKYLPLDPQTGRSEHNERQDIRMLPGATLWPLEQFSDQILLAAEKYLLVESDHREEWLGLPMYDYRARAGMQALSLLSSAEILGRLPDDRWAFWAGAVLEHISGLAPLSGDGLDSHIVKQVLEHAETALAEALSQFVRTSLARGSTASGLEVIATLRSTVLGSTYLSTADEIERALQNPNVRAGDESGESTVVLASDPIRFADSSEARSVTIMTWSRLVSGALGLGNSAAIGTALRVLGIDDEEDVRWSLRPGAGRCCCLPRKGVAGSM